MSGKAHLTHVAIQARDVGRSVAFYERYAGLHSVHDRTDGDVRVVWLSEDPARVEFVLVLIGVAPEAGRPFSPAQHLGYDLGSREAVDEMAAVARREGALAADPTDGGPVVGYYCVLRDPDGNAVEFSHGQAIKPDLRPS